MMLESLFWKFHLSKTVARGKSDNFRILISIKLELKTADAYMKKQVFHLLPL